MISFQRWRVIAPNASCLEWLRSALRLSSGLGSADKGALPNARFPDFFLKDRKCY